MNAEDPTKVLLRHIRELTAENNLLRSENARLAVQNDELIEQPKKPVFEPVHVKLSHQQVFLADCTGGFTRLLDDVGRELGRTLLQKNVHNRLQLHTPDNGLEWRFWAGVLK